MLHHGLYEQVINNALTSELAEIPEARKAVAPIDKAEASKVLAQYLTDVVQKGLDNVLDNGGDVSAQIELTNQIVDLIQNKTKEADFDLGVRELSELLNGFNIRGTHVRGGNNAQFSAVFGKLPKLVHQEAQAAPFDEGHQHINAVSRTDFFLELGV